MTIDGNNKIYIETSKDSVELPNEVFQAELKDIESRRKNLGALPTGAVGNENAKPDVKNKLGGLALSGGGIRSSTFNLGVMQALENSDALHRVDYLSTVSGGGYIGACLV